jgi:hypothetical protein
MAKSLVVSLGILLTVLMFFGCEKIKYIDYKALADAEKQLMTDFYASAMFDSLKHLAVAGKDSIVDERGDDNMGYYIIYTQMGTGDRVTSGKYVGIRYTEYGLGRENDNVAFVDTTNNYAGKDPYRFVAGNSPMRGLDLALANMNMFGKAIVVLPSVYWERLSVYETSSYTPLVFDIEVTYLGK